MSTQIKEQIMQFAGGGVPEMNGGGDRYLMTLPPVVLMYPHATGPTLKGTFHVPTDDMTRMSRHLGFISALGFTESPKHLTSAAVMNMKVGSAERACDRHDDHREVSARRRTGDRPLDPSHEQKTSDIPGQNVPRPLQGAVGKSAPCQLRFDHGLHAKDMLKCVMRKCRAVPQGRTAGSVDKLSRDADWGSGRTDSSLFDNSQERQFGLFHSRKGWGKWACRSSTPPGAPLALSSPGATEHTGSAELRSPLTPLSYRGTHASPTDYHRAVPGTLTCQHGMSVELMSRVDAGACVYCAARYGGAPVPFSTAVATVGHHYNQSMFGQQ
ncbi:hypothetical protein Bbelb_125420 [Branchiostoma belcheri]|nr:hypothetical protein Bbelb_125420 [Branchiostoma belcheri]